jgi:ketosteroid isomerase-like protein
MQRSPQIEQVLVNLSSQMATGDTEGIVAAHSTEDAALAIGTDQNEWAQGHAAIKQLWQAQPPMPDLRFEDLQCYEEGPIGWFSGKVTIPADEPLTMRVTGVLRKEAGEWKFIQSHASLPHDA